MGLKVAEGARRIYVRQRDLPGEAGPNRAEPECQVTVQSVGLLR